MKGEIPPKVVSFAAVIRVVTRHATTLITAAKETTLKDEVEK